MLVESGGVIFRFTPCKCPDLLGTTARMWL
jgi:hypothetical protein